MISLDKKHLPSYIYKINLAGVIFFIAWFCLCLPVAVIMGCIYDESVITYVVIALVFAVFFIGLAILVAIDKKLQKRLCAERTAQLEEEFCDMPFEEAEQILKERGIITDAGFIIKTDGVFGEEVLPFEEALFDFHFFQLRYRVNMDISLYSAEGYFAGMIVLDRAMYNFLANKKTELQEDFAFSLLLFDKNKFAEYALKFFKPLK